MPRSRKKKEAKVVNASVNPAQLFKLPVAAKRLDMSLNTLKKLVRAGRIAVVDNYCAGDDKSNMKGYRISEGEIQRYISSNEFRVRAL